MLFKIDKNKAQFVKSETYKICCVYIENFFTNSHRLTRISACQIRYEFYEVEQIINKID